MSYMLIPRDPAKHVQETHSLRRATNIVCRYPDHYVAARASAYLTAYAAAVKAAGGVEPTRAAVIDQLVRRPAVSTEV